MVIQLNLKQLAFKCICAISETSSSKHSLLITGVMLLSLTELVGDVRVSGGKTDSTVDISRARPSAGTVSCQVAELKASETSSAILVSLSAACNDIKLFRLTGTLVLLRLTATIHHYS